MFELSYFRVKSNIHRDTDLHYEAQARKQECQTEVSAFVFSHSVKYLNDLIENMWNIDTGKATIEREKKKRMESCIKGCEGEWYRCACEILQHNGINIRGY